MQLIMIVIISESITASINHFTKLLAALWSHGCLLNRLVALCKWAVSPWFWAFSLCACGFFCWFLCCWHSCNWALMLAHGIKSPHFEQYEGIWREKVRAQAEERLSYSPVFSFGLNNRRGRLRETHSSEKASRSMCWWSQSTLLLQGNLVIVACLQMLALASHVDL